VCRPLIHVFSLAAALGKCLLLSKPSAIGVMASAEVMSAHSGLNRNPGNAFTQCFYLSKSFTAMPLQGVLFLLNLEPKALPWADMPSPFRPEHKQRWRFGRQTLR